jgi:preprotein translocase subunit SecA
MATEVLEGIFATHIPEDAYADDWDLRGLSEDVQRHYGVQVSLTPEQVTDWKRQTLFEHLQRILEEYYTAKAQALEGEQFHALERWVILQVIDKHWKDHLLAMDYLKEGIGLRGYSQKNPLNEYKREGFEMFMGMTERIKSDVVEHLFKAQITASAGGAPTSQPPRQQRLLTQRGMLSTSQGNGSDTSVQTVRRQGEKVGRNAPCPCGSGKKYKRCCGV